MLEFGMHEAKTQLSKLVALAIGGEEVVITRDGVPAVRLVPVSARKPVGRKAGTLAGMMTWTDAFDEPMGPEFWGPEWELFVDPPDAKEPDDDAGPPAPSTQG